MLASGNAVFDDESFTCRQEAFRLACGVIEVPVSI